MRALLAVILVAATLWGGWWVYGWNSTTRAFDAWQAARIADGWQVEVAEARVRGFPNRFDLTLEEVTLTDPATGLGWQAPQVQIARLSYQPAHAIVTFPTSQTLIWPGQSVTLDSDRMRASLVTQGDDAQTLERVTLVADVLNVSGLGAMARMQMSARRAAPATETYDIALTADGFAPRLTALEFVDGTGLPAAFQTLSITGQAQFDKPWDQTALDDARPQPRKIAVDLAQVAWGRLTLRATGDLDIDPDGRPQGTLAVQARGWEEMLDLLRASDQLAPGMISALEQGLLVLSRINGRADSLDVSVVFDGGRVFAGPLPLGRAPRVSIR